MQSTTTQEVEAHKKRKTLSLCMHYYRRAMRKHILLDQHVEHRFENHASTIIHFNRKKNRNEKESGTITSQKEHLFEVRCCVMSACVRPVTC